MSEKEQITNEAPEGEDAGITNDSRGASQDEDAQNSSDSDSTPEHASSSQTPSDQESLTPELAAPDLDLLKEMNQHLLMLLTEQASGNQKLEKIQKDIEEVKEVKDKNFLEAEEVINPLIQFYDTFVSVESQLDDISAPLESVVSVESHDAISEPLESVLSSFESYTETVNENEKRRVGKNKKVLAAKLEELLESLGKLKTSLSQTDTEISGEPASSQEKPEDRSSLLSQANTKMTNELSRFRKNLENARYEFEEALVRIDDVTPYNTKPLSEFDRNIHDAIVKESTDDPKKDRKVVESHTAGFRRGAESVFRTEAVTVYRHEPLSDESEGATNGNPTDESEAAVDGKSTNKEGDKSNE